MHVKGQNRDQATLFLERLDDLIAEDNAARVMRHGKVAYNVQSVVDSKHRLIADIGTTKAQKTPRPATEKAGGIVNHQIAGWGILLRYNWGHLLRH
jgi:hypothetical protein